MTIVDEKRSLPPWLVGMENGQIVDVPQVKVDRPMYEQDELNKILKYNKPKKNYWKDACSQFRTCNLGSIIGSAVPAINWLRHYRLRSDLCGDLVAGFTVAIMHIPQGMAYALLGNVPPVIGIYMAFFPVLVYSLLGTSRHNSMGSFAVICLMAGNTVLKFSHMPDTKSIVNLLNETNSNVEDTKTLNYRTDENSVYYTPVEVASTLALIVGIFQVIMYFFRLGIISSLLSETLVSGFTTGAAIQVFTSQLKDVIGVKIPKPRGYFVVVKTVVSIIENIGTINLTATVISAISVTIMVVNNEVLKPWLSKKCFLPVPIELIAVVTGTVLSKYLSFQETYNITVVGTIPSGLPEPALPQLSILNNPDILIDGLIIAIVSYSISLSMALIFAQKLSYEVDANQELLAQGLGNAVGSCFSCLPFAASLSRSVIQQNVGGKTQMASIVSCGLLLIVLLWIGPMFEPLPKCILASVIIVALKGLLMQTTELIKFWRLSKMDAVVWLVSFLTVVLISIDIGLLVGLTFSVITIFVLGLKPYTCLLGNVHHTDLYLDINRYKAAEELSGIKIYHYCGGLNFASRNYFRSELCRLVGMQPQKELIRRKKMQKRAQRSAEQLDDGGFCNEVNPNNTSSLENITGNRKTKQRKEMSSSKEGISLDIKFIILDFSALSYVDPSGVTCLKLLAEDFRKIDIAIYVASCSGPVYETMEKCQLINCKENLLRVFPTVHDAVQCVGYYVPTITSL